MSKPTTSLVVTISCNGESICDPISLDETNNLAVGVTVGWRTLLGALLRRRRLDLTVRVMKVTIEKIK